MLVTGAAAKFAPVHFECRAQLIVHLSQRIVQFHAFTLPVQCESIRVNAAKIRSCASQRGAITTNLLQRENPSRSNCTNYPARSAVLKAEATKMQLLQCLIQL